MKHIKPFYVTITALMILVITANTWCKNSDTTPPTAEQTKGESSDNIPEPEIIDPNLLHLTTDAPSLVSTINLLAKKIERPKIYYLPHYHHQVTQKQFLDISYPYYLGGQDFALKDLPDLTSFPGVIRPPQKIDTKPKDNKGQKQEKDKTPVIITPPAPTTTAIMDIKTTRYNLENLQNLIHRWRQFNETSRTTLEILRGQNLTKTSTNIYNTKPKLAISVKRTLGQIALINRHFDITNRMAMEAILTNGPHKNYIARMDKQLADLASRLDRLTEQNDQISIALGLGKIDRKSDYPSDDRIHFSNMVPAE